MSSIETYFKTNIAEDYSFYQKFCTQNNLLVASYSDFIEYISNITGINVIDVEKTNFIEKPFGTGISKPCGSCGGGKVR